MLHLLGASSPFILIEFISLVLPFLPPTSAASTFLLCVFFISARFHSHMSYLVLFVFHVDNQRTYDSATHNSELKHQQ